MKAQTSAGPSLGADRDTLPMLDSATNEGGKEGADSELYASGGDAMRGWAILASRS